jgi:uncharacterized membrane protein YfbV (UPF0208 family)
MRFKITSQVAMGNHAEKALIVAVILCNLILLSIYFVGIRLIQNVEDSTAACVSIEMGLVSPDPLITEVLCKKYCYVMFDG